MTIGELKTKFSQQNNLLDAFRLIQQRRVWHDWYQHYTTLSSVLDKIDGKWWLTRSDSDRLNDQQEFAKFGDFKTARSLYQTSFCQGSSEDVAMWGLYQLNNPLAIRISISGDALQKWLSTICFKEGDALSSRQKKCKALGFASNVKYVSFGDLIYVAVANPEGKSDDFDIRRSNSIYWNHTHGGDRIQNLQRDIASPWATAQIKDYEWRYERESRLIVRLKQANGPRALPVDVPHELFAHARFTFSPWLPRQCEGAIETILKQALAKVGIESKCKTPFRRSVLQGALNIRHNAGSDELLKVLLPRMSDSGE